MLISDAVHIWREEDGDYHVEWESSRPGARFTVEPLNAAGDVQIHYTENPSPRLRLAGLPDGDRHFFRVRDEQGKPLAVRAHIKDAREQFVLPPGEPSKRKTTHGGPFADEYFYIDGDLSIDLAAGLTQITLVRGVSYSPVQETLKIPAAGTVQKIVTLRRMVYPAQRGWWSADEH